MHSNARFNAAGESTRATTAATPYGSELCEREPVLDLIQWQLHVELINSTGEKANGEDITSLFPF